MKGLTLAHVQGQPPSVCAHLQNRYAMNDQHMVSDTSAIASSSSSLWRLHTCPAILVHIVIYLPECGLIRLGSNPCAHVRIVRLITLPGYRLGPSPLHHVWRPYLREHERAFRKRGSHFHQASAHARILGYSCYITTLMRSWYKIQRITQWVRWTLSRSLVYQNSCVEIC